MTKVIKKVIKVILTLTVLVILAAMPAHANDYGEVSTIIGNGTAGQTSMLLDHPRDITTLGKDIYFVDGTHRTAKLRMFNGKKLSTVVDLAKSPMVRRDKFFVATGMESIDKDIFITSNFTLYKVVGAKITGVDKVNKYLKDIKMEYLYRSESYGGWIYIMYTMKNQTYSFMRYQPSDGTIEPLLDNVWTNDPLNFYVDDKGIVIAGGAGQIDYEQFFPRDSKEYIDTNTGSILDAWVTNDGQLMYSMTQDGMYAKIYTVPIASEDAGDISLVAGGTRGYYDGVLDEVQMDGPTDFTWDGSGYLFADKGNNMIRKLWSDSPPSNNVSQ